jgi:hypothetical protein
MDYFPLRCNIEEKCLETQRDMYRPRAYTQYLHTFTYIISRKSKIDPGCRVCAMEAFYKLPAAHVHLIYVSLDTPRQQSDVLCKQNTHKPFRSHFKGAFVRYYFYSLDKKDFNFKCRL